MATRRQKEKRKIQYGDARKQAIEHQSGYDRTTLSIPEGFGFFAPKKPGIYRIDVIPFITGKGNPHADKGVVWYERTYFAHRGIGPNQSSYICPRKTAGKDCPVCEFRAKTARDPDADDDLLKELAPKERQLFLIRDLSDKEKGLQLWDISHHLFGKFLIEKIKNADEDDGYEQFFHLDENGRSLKLGATEESFGGRSFLKFTDIEFKPRKDALGEDVLDEAPCLDDCLKILGYEELKKLFLQVEDEEDEEEDEEEEDEKPRRKNKPAAEDEEEEDEEDEDEEDEDEEEEDEEDEDEEEDEEPKSSKGKSKGKTTAAKDKWEEEDEEEDEGEEEEEEPTKASDVGIKIGSKVKHPEHGRCKVVHISGDGTSLRIEDSDGDVHKAIGCDDVKLLKKAVPF